MRNWFLAPFAIASILLLPACQSTQSQSAQLEAAGGKLAKTSKVDVGAANTKVDVSEKVVLSDENGSAVAVVLKNNSDQGLADAPIAINVKDNKGKSVYRNNLAGVDPALLTVPVIKPHDEVYWINDQVLATSPPKSVDVTVGEAKQQLPNELPEIDVTTPDVKNDPTSGIEATGFASNKSQVEQTDLVLYAIARKNGKIVAAGRGLIPKLKVGGKQESYHIFFIGDPTGADVTVAAPPVNLE